MANKDACEIFIEQEIDDGLQQGKTAHSIGKDLSDWIGKLFQAKIKPATIAKRAQRRRNKLGTNVPTTATPPNNSQKGFSSGISGISSSGKSGHGGARSGAGKKKVTKFNETNDNIEWARWTWNPVTGCNHGCHYCYARDIAIRFDGHFKPIFHPNRLAAPQNTKLTNQNPKFTPEGNKNVFVCSMADLFGDWVPDEWIDKVFDAIRNSPQWNYILLTKNPKRYLKLQFPENVMIGATADTQKRADAALKVFFELTDGKQFPNIKFLSCEPLLEKIDFGLHLPTHQLFDWIIVGGQSKTVRAPEFQPDWEWIRDYIFDFEKYKIPYYFKPNLKSRPRMYPKRP